ncbi:MAG: 2-nitropropane dioxygenase, partial [Thermoleophilia bacterium]|nr:2-nitropropane dioxygenase [Thermoleophilia bacterium]
GYASAATMTAHVAELRSRTERAFGVNVFVMREARAVDQKALARYMGELKDDARRFEVEVGAARFDDDDFDAKIASLVHAPVAVVSFTFGCPDAETVKALRAVGSQVWITVATVDDARTALATGCDALVAQGAEAGGHRGAFVDDEGVGALATAVLVSRIVGLTSCPVVAAGGIMTTADARRALDAGAAAVQAGTAFLLTPEAGTNAVHRRAVGTDAPTAFTRAFTGRTARGIVNRFMQLHHDAPAAYPHIHYATATIRAAARKQGDPDFVNLWAGTGHRHCRPLPAGDVVRSLQV